MTDDTRLNPADQVTALVERFGTGDNALWRAIQERALMCPTLQATVHQHEHLGFTRIEALALAALLLSFCNERLINQEADRLARLVISRDHIEGMIRAAAEDSPELQRITASPKGKVS